LRRQTRKPSISQGNWNCVGRQRAPRDRVAGQPVNPVTRQPASCWYVPKPGQPTLLFHQISSIAAVALDLRIHSLR
jgi:hypothetical protein